MRLACRCTWCLRSPRLSLRGRLCGERCSRLTSSLTQLITVASVLPRESGDLECRTVLERTVRSCLTCGGVHALVRPASAEDPSRGSCHLGEAYGVGALRQNTIVPGDRSGPTCGMATAGWSAPFTVRGKIDVVVCDAGSDVGDRKRVYVWWDGKQADAALMLLLSRLLKGSVGAMHRSVGNLSCRRLPRACGRRT